MNNKEIKQLNKVNGNVLSKVSDFVCDMYDGLQNGDKIGDTIVNAGMNANKYLKALDLSLIHI